MDIDYSNIKYYGIRAGAALMLIVIITTLCWIFLGHGWLQVTVPDGAEVSIIEDSQEAKTTTTKKSGTQFLGVGKYIVRTKSTKGASEEVVDVKPFSKQDILPTIKDKREFSAVSNGDITSIHSTNNGVYYIDSSSKRLMFIPKNESPRPVFGHAVTIYQMVWDGEIGIGIGISIGGTVSLYRVDSDQSSQVVMPGTGSPSLAIDPSTHTWWLLRGGALYRANTKTTTPNLVMDSIPSGQITDARQDRVAVIIASETKSELYIIDTTTKQNKQISITRPTGVMSNLEFRWNNDGSQATLIDSNGLRLFDKNIEERQIALPSTIQSAFWDNDEIVYSNNQFVWRYNTKTRSATLLSELPVYNKVQSLKPDGSDIYVKLHNSAGYLWYRLSDKIDSTNVSMIAESNTQQFSDSCRMYFTNFNRPVILISTSEDTSAVCRKSITDYMESIRVTPSAWEFFITTN